MQYWHTSDTCAYRGIVNNHVWLARSVIVVKDNRRQTILLLLPGAQCVYPEGYWHWRKDLSHGTRWQEARQEVIPLREFTWQTSRILIFLEPGKYYSTWLFWDHATDQFDCYYINYELPYRRSACGFDTLDLDLDIVVDPQYHWNWKDEDEYREGIREGGILKKWVEGVERSHAEVFERIEKRRPPLDGSWVQWQPDPAWTPPRLPEGWQVV
jgi:protein associated with RNAse G/E